MKSLVATLLTSVILASTAQAGLALGSGHWARNSTITIAVENARGNDMACLRFLTRELEAVVPLRFSYVEAGPRVRADVHMEIKRQDDTRAGWSHLGNGMFRLERMMVVIPEYISNHPTFSEYMCRNVRRVVLHELGHLLGLLHEHSHPDAPELIRRAVVASSTVQDNAQLRRYPRSRQRIATSYDLGSVMHYGFAVDEALARTLVELGTWPQFFSQGRTRAGEEFFSVTTPGNVWRNRVGVAGYNPFFVAELYSLGDRQLLQRIYGAPASAGAQAGADGAKTTFSENGPEAGVYYFGEEGPPDCH